VNRALRSQVRQRRFQAQPSELTFSNYSLALETDFLVLTVAKRFVIGTTAAA
jgi:hypothetical protein